MVRNTSVFENQVCQNTVSFRYSHPRVQRLNQKWYSYSPYSLDLKRIHMTYSLSEFKLLKEILEQQTLQHINRIFVAFMEVLCCCNDIVFQEYRRLLSRGNKAFENTGLEKEFLVLSCLSWYKQTSWSPDDFQVTLLSCIHIKPTYLLSPDIKIRSYPRYLMSHTFPGGKNADKATMGQYNTGKSLSRYYLHFLCNAFGRSFKWYIFFIYLLLSLLMQYNNSSTRQ